MTEQGPEQWPEQGPGGGPGEPPPTDPGGHLPDISPWSIAGMVGMACVFFLFAASKVVVPAAPWLVVVALLVVWAAALVLAVRWFTPKPVQLAWLPLALGVGWFAVVLAGARLLDWA